MTDTWYIHDPEPLPQHQTIPKFSMSQVPGLVSDASLGPEPTQNTTLRVRDPVRLQQLQTQMRPKNILAYREPKASSGGPVSYERHTPWGEGDIEPSDTNQKTSDPFWIKPEWWYGGAQTNDTSATRAKPKRPPFAVDNAETLARLEAEEKEKARKEKERNAPQNASMTLISKSLAQTKQTVPRKASVKLPPLTNGDMTLLMTNGYAADWHKQHDAEEKVRAEKAQQRVAHLKKLRENK